VSTLVVLRRRFRRDAASTTIADFAAERDRFAPLLPVLVAVTAFCFGIVDRSIAPSQTVPRTS
jgi:hypothetical protein